MTAKIVFLGIHGLPQSDVDPSSQLDPIRAALAPVSGLVDVSPRFGWCEGTGTDLRNALTLLKNGTFGDTFVPVIDGALGAAGAQSDPVLVVAFSAGGYLFYRWLVERRPNTDRLAVVAIAAPYRNRGRGFRLRPSQRNPFPFQDPDLRAQDIAASLRPGRLLVLMAEHDGTISWDDAAFDADEDGGVELINNEIVIQHIILGVDHGTICAAGETSRYIVEYASRL